MALYILVLDHPRRCHPGVLFLDIPRHLPVGAKSNLPEGPKGAYPSRKTAVFREWHVYAIRSVLRHGV